jgi:hypothetical protein
MNKRRNIAVSILIGLTLVLPCVAQTSQAEKEILDWSRRSAATRENVDCFHQEGRGVESVPLADMHVQIDPSRDTAVASSLPRVKTRSAKGVVSDENIQEFDVWFKRNGEWEVVHLYYSPPPKTK